MGKRKRKKKGIRNKPARVGKMPDLPEIETCRSQLEKNPHRSRGKQDAPPTYEESRQTGRTSAGSIPNCVSLAQESALHRAPGLPERRSEAGIKELALAMRLRLPNSCPPLTDPSSPAPPPPSMLLVMLGPGGICTPPGIPESGLVAP